MGYTINGHGLGRHDICIHTHARARVRARAHTHTHTQNGILAIKKNEILPFAAANGWT